MQGGFRFRCYPTPAQAATLLRWIGCQRYVYNAKLEEQRYLSWLKRRAILSPSWHSTGGLAADAAPSTFDQAFSHLKTEHTAFLREVPAVVLRNGIYRLKTALSNHWRNPAHFGWPVRQKRGAVQSVLLTRELFRFEDGVLHLGNTKQRIGALAVRFHRAHPAPSMLTVARTGSGKWFLSFSADDNQEQPVPATPTRMVGHDVGTVRLVQTSDGRTYNPTRAWRDKQVQRLRRLKRLQRKLARQQRGSMRRQRTRRKIASVHERMANARRDLAHQVSHRLVTEAPDGAGLAFEQLSIRNMTRAPKARMRSNGSWAPNGASAKAALNRALLGLALSQLIRFTAYKAARAARHCERVPAQHSSTTCAVCGHVDPNNRLTQAEFHCRACGHTANADANASAVIEQRATLAVLARPSGSAGRKSTVEGHSGRHKATRLNEAVQPEATAA